MTAAKVMDIISRLPGCAGQAADAVSAYTQVKMESDIVSCPIRRRNNSTKYLLPASMTTTSKKKK